MSTLHSVVIVIIADSFSKYVTPQGETGDTSLETQNELWVPDDELYHYITNAFY